MTTRRDSLTDGAEMARGALVNTLALLVSNLRGVFTFLIARLLGQASLGVFALAWSWTDLISKIGNFGLDSGVTPLIAKKEAVGDRAGCRRLMDSSVRWGLRFSILTSVLSILALWTFGTSQQLDPEFVQGVGILLLALPGIALYRISTSVSRGMRVMGHDVYSRGLTETLGTLATFLILIAVGLHPFAPFVAVLVGTGAGGLVAYRLASSLFRRDPIAPAHESISKPLLAFSAPIALYNMLNLFIMRMDVLLLGWYVNSAPGVTFATLGIFAACVDTAGGMRKVRQVFDPIFTPIVAKHSIVDDRESMQRSFAQLGRWVLAVQLPLVGLLWLSGGLILSIFGPGFEAGAPWLALLAVAHGTNTFVGIAETVIMVHHPMLNLANSSLTAILQFVASLLLIPRLGPTGAALGMVLAYATQGVLRSYELRVMFKWRWPWREFMRPAGAALFAILPSAAVKLLMPGKLGQLIAGLLFVGLYMGAWRALGLDATDRAVLQELRQRRGRRATRTAVSGASGRQESEIPENADSAQPAGAPTDPPENPCPPHPLHAKADPQQI